ncbi:MAG TPA: hypothetical protein VMZ22_08615 [Acidimicrobiales bacterium]|nr:hypothetical protein [Acidimicrobiales bacterium]
MELVTEKTLHFAHDRAAVWAAMADVGSYQRWWPWLRRFDAAELATHAVWRCTVRPPLGYTVSFSIAFTRVVASSVVEARVSGDIAGDAELLLSDAGDACEVLVRSDLQPESRFLRILANTAPPVARFGHDWVLTTGARQFEHRALLNVGAQDTTK